MKSGFKVILLAMITVFMMSGSGIAGETVKFILRADPASFMISPDVDGFYIQGPGIRDEIDGSTAWTPSIDAGIGFNVGDSVLLDATLGVGWYYGGEALESSFVTQRLSARFKLGKTMTLGAQAGLIQFDNLDWKGDYAGSNVQFSSSDGYLAGLSFTAGSERVSFSLSVEYVSLDDFDVTTTGGWTPSSNSLDLSGALVNMGVLLRF
ncbi:MAG: hypothetical protein LJE66_14130 [Desulfobacterales bacterium]|jgi:hypothetical protein|nr:hypothetical protein [Desulfobacterales bacterium]